MPISDQPRGAGLKSPLHHRSLYIVLRTKDSARRLQDDQDLLRPWENSGKITVSFLAKANLLSRLMGILSSRPECAVYSCHVFCARARKVACRTLLVKELAQFCFLLFVNKQTDRQVGRWERGWKETKGKGSLRKLRKFCGTWRPWSACKSGWHPMDARNFLIQWGVCKTFLVTLATGLLYGSTN